MNESTLNGALRVTIERAPLAAALALLVRGVTRRNTIPILSNVAISADDTGNGMLRFLVTNLDQQILIDVPAYVDAPGALTCDAAALADIVRKCPAGARVELMHHVDAGKVSIVAGRARSAIGVMPRHDFPAVADVAPAWSFQYDRDALALDLARLAPCISSEETRYYLNGVAWRARRGGLALVASDGVQAAVIDRAGFPDAAGLGDAGTISGGAILPRAAVDLLQRAVKLADAGAVACMFDSARAQFTVTAAGSFVTIKTKLIDGEYPDVIGALDSAMGDGLARVMFPEIDDRINAGMLAKLAKPCAGAVAVDMGAGGAIVTCEAAPEYLGFMMAVRDGANKIGKFEYRGDDWRAVQYLRSLAVAGGIDVEALDSVDENDKPVLCPARLIQGAGTVTGATFGKVEYIPASYVEAVNYDTLTVERVKVEARNEYQAGAFSIAMPAAAALVHCDVTADYGDGERAIRTDSAGAIQWDAATVARMAGDLSECPIQRVKIAPLHQYRGAALPAGWIMPAAVKVKKAKRDDAAALAAYCAGNVEAAPVPVWTGARPRVWNRVELHCKPMAWSWQDDGASDAEAAAAVDDPAVRAAAVMSPAALVEAAREAVELSAPVAVEAVEPHSGAVSVESSDAPETVAEAVIPAEALAVAEIEALPDAMPDATPFAVPDALKTSQFDKPAADVAPDLAALVASLVARIEALESERAPAADDVAAPVAVDNGGGAKWHDAWNEQRIAALTAASERDVARIDLAAETARADDLAAQLAAMTRDRDDWQAIAEQNHAGLVEARADLAEMTAVRDRHREARNAADDANKALRRRRYRTAAAIRKVRGRADLDKRALAATVEHVAQWRDDLDNARVALAAVTARAERAESELKRRTVLDPLAGLRYAGGAARATL